jgi:hypothetical protein
MPGELIMDNPKEKRREKRLSHQWPVWFSEDFKEAVFQGMMVDVSSGGLAFTCNSDENCPQAGQQLMTRFSIPRFRDDDPSAMTSFTRTGRVLRVDILNNYVCRVAIQFYEPLSLKPGEQAAVELMHQNSAES